MPCSSSVLICLNISNYYRPIFLYNRLLLVNLTYILICITYFNRYYHFIIIKINFFNLQNYFFWFLLFLFLPFYTCDFLNITYQNWLKTNICKYYKKMLWNWVFSEKKIQWKFSKWKIMMESLVRKNIDIDNWNYLAS